jgi:trehalose 6-phosphate phosphatase
MILQYTNARPQYCTSYAALSRDYGDRGLFASLLLSAHAAMQILQPGFDLERFFADLALTKTRALLLDYDGTLAPFQIERDQACPYPGVRELLSAIQRAGHTRLVVVSGRAIADLEPLLGLDPAPELWGAHGWERRLSGGARQLAALDPAAARGLDEAWALALAGGLAERCERKPTSLALHWRGLPVPAAQELRGWAQQNLTILAERGGLVAHDFDGGIELRAPGRDKGYAVRTILGELGEGAMVAYLGDDLTDEDAFAAIKGRGLAGLVRAEARPTIADIRLHPPDELLIFLRRWHEA